MISWPQWYCQNNKIIYVCESLVDHVTVNRLKLLNFSLNSAFVFSFLFWIITAEMDNNCSVRITSKIKQKGYLTNNLLLTAKCFLITQQFCARSKNLLGTELDVNWDILSMSIGKYSSLIGEWWVDDTILGIVKYNAYILFFF